MSVCQSRQQAQLRKWWQNPLADRLQTAGSALFRAFALPQAEMLSNPSHAEVVLSIPALHVGLNLHKDNGNLFLLERVQQRQQQRQQH